MYGVAVSFESPLVVLSEPMVLPHSSLDEQIMKIFTDIACIDYERPGHPERPQRVGATLERLETDKALGAVISKPLADATEFVELVHPYEFVKGLNRSQDFDADTPAHEGIETHALRSVAGALDAMESALAGEVAFSLLRPPGHHASAETAMGFCYLNQVAVAAKVGAKRGLAVGILDFDVHHGNGTEASVLGAEGILYTSVHQSPAFPNTGNHSRGNCKNYPIRPHARRQDFVDGVMRCLDDILAFGPDLIAVSAGFDAFRGDPLAQENLEGEDYFTFGRAFKDTGVPTFSVLEGGYSDDLPQLVVEYLKGLS